MSETEAAPAVDADVFFGDVLPVLHEAWGTSEEVYQFENARSRNVVEKLGFLAGRRVLDVGCNTGMYAFALAPVAEYVYGIDQREGVIAQANAAKEHLQERGEDVSHLVFEWRPFSRIDFERHAFDAVLACNVLYHLDDAEIGILDEILRGCRSAFFQMRPRRVLAYERSKDTFHYVSRNEVCGGLYTLGHGLEFLQRAGFSTFEISGEERYWGDEPFPLLLAERSE